MLTYFSDVVEAVFGFKRLSLAPVEAAQVRADWLISTHEHLDHLDAEALLALARANPWCRFHGTGLLPEVYESAGIAPGRQVILEPGRQHEAWPRDRAREGRSRQPCPRRRCRSCSTSGGQHPVHGRHVVLARADPSADGQKARTCSLPASTAGSATWAAEAAELASVAAPESPSPAISGCSTSTAATPGVSESCAAQCPRTEARLLSPGEGVFVTTQSAERIEC